MNRLALVAAFVAILAITAGLSYALRNRTIIQSAARTADTGISSGTGDQSKPSETPRSSPEPSPRNNTLLGELFGQNSPELAPSSFASGELVAALVALRFALAAFLAAILAFRPRPGVATNRINPYVGQTQILMAVVAAAMMMVVGDSAARAFGIFAAASLVRFRTNIRDPKEITVLLVCLGVGLAAGVGRWDMAIILSLF